jgi:hypothetical protein
MTSILMRATRLGWIHAPEGRNYDLPIRPGNEPTPEMFQTEPRARGIDR